MGDNYYGKKNAIKKNPEDTMKSGVFLTKTHSLMSNSTGLLKWGKKMGLDALIRTNHLNYGFSCISIIMMLPSLARIIATN